MLTFCETRWRFCDQLTELSICVSSICNQLRRLRATEAGAVCNDLRMMRSSTKQQHVSTMCTLCAVHCMLKCSRFFVIGCLRIPCMPRLQRKRSPRDCGSDAPKKCIIILMTLSSGNDTESVQSPSASCVPIHYSQLADGDDGGDSIKSRSLLLLACAQNPKPHDTTVCEKNQLSSLTHNNQIVMIIICHSSQPRSDSKEHKHHK